MSPFIAQIPPIGIQLGNQDDSQQDELSLAIQALLLITILSFGTAIITMEKEVILMKMKNIFALRFLGDHLQI